MSKSEYLKIDSSEGKSNAACGFPQLSSHPDLEERLPFHGLNLSSTLENQEQEVRARIRRKRLIGAFLSMCSGRTSQCIAYAVPRRGHVAGFAFAFALFPTSRMCTALTTMPTNPGLSSHSPLLALSPG